MMNSLTLLYIGVQVLERRANACQDYANNTRNGREYRAAEPEIYASKLLA
jgi:hypothetical protein